MKNLSIQCFKKIVILCITGLGAFSSHGILAQERQSDRYNNPNYNPILTPRQQMALPFIAVVVAGAACYGAYRTYRYFKPAPVKELGLDDSEDTQSMSKKIAQELKESAKIYGLSITAATAYGILQDQVTYRYCPEYFTKSFHKEMMDQWEGQPILGTAKKLFDNNPDNPTVRAAIWGTVASWWMGAILGVPITLACRIGSWKKLTYKDIAKPLAVTMGLTGISSVCAGFNKHTLLQAQEQKDTTSTDIFGQIISGNIEGVCDQHGFKVDGAAHNAAYATGPLWSIGLIFYILKARYELSKHNNSDDKNIE